MMRYGEGNQYGYVLVSVAAPVGVTIALSLFVQARKQRYRKPPPSDAENRLS
jgi:hypothetical protein